MVSDGYTADEYVALVTAPQTRGACTADLSDGYTAESMFAPVTAPQTPDTCTADQCIQYRNDHK